MLDNVGDYKAGEGVWSFAGEYLGTFCMTFIFKGSQKSNKP